MARLTDKQRLARVVEFIAGLSHPEVRATLATRGYTQRDADAGFALLRAALDGFHAGQGQPKAPPNTLSLLDAWENRWLPIARAALKRHHPEVARTVFLNLHQTSGPDLVIGVGVLLNRIDALDRAGATEERRARALLARRGLTKAVVAEARQLLQALQQAPVLTAAPAPLLQRQPTLDRLWEWYLEWSATARAVLSDRRLLNALGFSPAGFG